MRDSFSRTGLLLGEDNLDVLARSSVAVFGIGGVGSFAAESLCRSGVGHFLLVDHDVVSVSNINRQIHATTRTIGRKKTDVMRERMLEINPETDICVMDRFYEPRFADDFFSCPFDYIVDALDTVTAKISLVMEAKRRNIPIISSMGAGNKLDPTRFEIADIYETSVCPLAKVMRRELHKRGIPHLKVVFSKEPPIHSTTAENEPDNPRRTIPGSVSFVPPVAGLILAGEVVRDLIGVKRQ